MTARSLVFEVGDRVTGSGTVFRWSDLDPIWAPVDAHGVWLDLARVRWGWGRRPDRCVRLIGADLAAVPTEFGPNTIPGAVTITGIWLGDAIEVQSQAPTRPSPPERWEWTTPPCPRPAGGWPRGKPDRYLEYDIGDLQESGAAVGTALFRPSPEQAVLVVAATDMDAVRTVLQPQLPGRLCIVPSRWTRAQLDDVMAHLSSHVEKRMDSDVRGPGWKLEVWGQHADEHGQPYIQAHLFRVTADLADWADTLPDGLLKLIPALTPAARYLADTPLTRSID